MSIRTKVYETFYQVRDARIINSQNKKLKSRMSKYPTPIQQITPEQKDAISSYFSKFEMKTNPLFHTWATNVSGLFTERYIHPGLFYTQIEPILNDRRLVRAWADKSYYDFYFPELRFPKTIIRNISGRLYDSEYCLIDKSKANVNCMEYEYVAVKPSIDSGGGNSVQLVKTSSDIISQLTTEYIDGNYVIQEVAKQHTTISSLNDSSINIVRIISVLMDGEVYIVNSAMRVGAPGSFNDNYIDKDDRSMLTIGIDKNGHLKNKAFFASGEIRSKCLNGNDFSGIVIPKYDEMMKIIKHIHLKLGHFTMISWDFFVSEDGNPSIMEYNIIWQGIAYYQYANGALFGDFSDQILTYVKDRKRILHKHKI